MDAAAIPLPSEETTPPVTKMYRVLRWASGTGMEGSRKGGRRNVRCPTRDGRSMDKIAKTEEQWRAELSPEQYAVLRQQATEAPFTGQYVDSKTPGVYKCAGCGAELFRS